MYTQYFTVGVSKRLRFLRASLAARSKEGQPMTSAVAASTSIAISASTARIKGCSREASENAAMTRVVEGLRKRHAHDRGRCNGAIHG